MIVAEALAFSRVAPRVGGDTGQEKGRTQKSEIGVHSPTNFIRRKRIVVRPPGIEPGLPPRKGGILAPRQRPRESRKDDQWKGWIISIRPKSRLSLWSQGCLNTCFKDIARVNSLGISVEGLDHRLNSPQSIFQCDILVEGWHLLCDNFR